jgi:hypothetical protein
MANTIPTGSYPVSGTAVGAAGALTVTLGSTTNVGRTVNITGFSFTAAGATADANVTITMTYAPVSGTAITLGTWTYVQGSGVSTSLSPMVTNLIPPMPAYTPITGATNSTTTTPVGSVSITATAGAGTTNAAINMWGYLQ